MKFDPLGRRVIPAPWWERARRRVLLGWSVLTGRDVTWQERLEDGQVMRVVTGYVGAPRRRLRVVRRLLAYALVAGISCGTTAMFSPWLGRGAVWVAVGIAFPTGVLLGVLIRRSDERARERQAGDAAYAALFAPHHDEQAGGD